MIGTASSPSSPDLEGRLRLPAEPEPGRPARRAAAAPTAEWWTVLRQPAEPRSRMLLFPHSGAGPYALLQVAALAPASAEVLGLTLPGRDHRLAEAPGTTLAEVTASVGAELLPRPRLPTVAFGCSLGALLATRVAARFPELCSALVVASQTPGTRHRWPDDAVTEPDLIRVLRAAGGVPEAVLADEAIRAGLLSRLGADLRLGAEAGREFGRVRVAVPLTVLGGRSDPLVPAHSLAGWAAHTTSRCRVVPLDGGHFGFLAPEHRGSVAAVLRRVFRESAQH